MKPSRSLGGLIIGISCLSAVRADPWLAPGDESIRHDIELLADAGILRGPVSTWPMSWPDIARDALRATSVMSRDAATQSALLRVQRLARAASARGFSGLGMGASAAYEPVELRGFASTPRESGELGLRASWLGDHIAVNLQATAVANAQDEKTYRADGSYLGVNVGNIVISAGYMERWWGPGWDASLILSTNARPIPSLTLERNYTDPFKSPLLSWIGPWRASIAVGQAEGSEVAIADVRFLAARINARPLPWLELGLSRTAQWCGEGRVCNLSTFGNLLVGRDNRDESLAANEEPGNQMAGYDLRLRSPWKRIPLVFHTQWIGEDEAGGLPSKFLGQFGVETWGNSGLGSWRVRAEYSDTACTFSRQDPDFDCAYRNARFPQGYTHRGRTIGHSMDNDGRMYSLGALLVREDGDSVSLTWRRVELNRNGGPHTITTAPLDLDNVELRVARDLRLGRVVAAVGYGDPGPDSDVSEDVHAFVTWQQGF